jgi:hypothetical protein
MPRKKNKTSHCLNCGFEFHSINNYCPQCGQENDDKRKSLRSFIRDFWDDLLQIDNNFFRSIIPFLFKPGKLTNEYNAGRRRYYVAPIRMYLIFSFLYFFLIAFEIKKNTSGSNEFTDKSLAEMAKSGNQKTYNLDTTLRNVDIVKKSVENLQKNNPKQAKEKKAKDSTKVKEYGINTGFRFNGIFIRNISANALMEMAKSGKTENQILDSLKIEKGFWTRLELRQMIRLGNATPAMILQSIMEKIPIMMFFLLPMFALFLKLMYIRSRRYYVEHLIFTLHLQSFSFFMFIFLLIFFELFETFYDGSVLMISLLLLTFYAYKSFRNVYKQNRFKTIVKMIILGNLYVFSLLILFLMTVIAGLLFF